MGRIASFCKWLDKQVANHSLYLWGGQGENVETKGNVNMKLIADMEQSEATAKRVVDKIMDCYFAGYDMSKARFFDCSGLGVCYFLAKGFIKYDTTADGLYKLCSVHPSFEKLKKGDMVFKSKTSAGKWGHVGYVSGVDENGALLVTEARGRDYGVVTRPLDVGGWIGTGRPDFWSKTESKAA